MLTEILIDPNVRVEGNLTFSGFEDVEGDVPNEGDYVVVREPESDLSTLGRVRRVDYSDKLVYLDVDWKTLAPDWVPSPEQLTCLLLQLAIQKVQVGSQAPVTANPGTSKTFNFNEFSETDLLLTA